MRETERDRQTNEKPVIALVGTFSGPLLSCPRRQVGVFIQLPRHFTFIFQLNLYDLLMSLKPALSLCFTAGIGLPFIEVVLPFVIIDFLKMGGGGGRCRDAYGCVCFFSEIHVCERHSMMDVCVLLFSIYFVTL